MMKNSFQFLTFLSNALQVSLSLAKRIHFFSNASDNATLAFNDAKGNYSAHEEGHNGSLFMMGNHVGSL